MEKEKKIREWLGDRYHLCIEHLGKGKYDWYLYKKYENCDPVMFSKANQPIMTSKNNTEEQLYNFAKAHHKISYEKSNRDFRTFMIYGILALSIINIIFFRLPELSWAIFGADIVFLGWITMDWIIAEKNHKVNILEIIENSKRTQEFLKGEKENARPKKTR